MFNIKALSIFASIILLFFCFIAIVDGARGMSREELSILLCFSVASTILNIIVIIKSSKNESDTDGSKNIISLWIKRKRLEEEKRIKELTK
ncbi:hypothetical protein [Pectobacterium sp. 21LCBS03]|uniref:hypothetical protein n=1 Tax=Pectobacterium sp. 21LCBS03 TaxID=2935858 RepID=UPI00200FACFA|nr:hypothetical protein [Pectobacterium sp. 21LCBS03]UPY96269.1 hypothetical protein MYB54_06055 [Pectobacterium sp. 21LCBS03]